MDPAFEFLAAPTAGTRVRARRGNRRARLTADAQVAAVVLREIRELMLTGEFPYPRPRPIREQADFQECFAARQFVVLDLFETPPRRRLLAPQSRKPQLERLQRFHERFYFSKLAALRRVEFVQNPKFRFLLLHRRLRRHVYQIQLPVPGDLIAKPVGIGEVISSFKKQHGNVWKPLPQERKDDHVFRLKTAGEASRRRREVLQNRLK